MMIIIIIILLLLYVSLWSFLGHFMVILTFRLLRNDKAGHYDRETIRNFASGITNNPRVRFEELRKTTKPIAKVTSIIPNAKA
jgi:hypothetical protein